MRIISIILMLSLSPTAAALRCGTELVTKGDHVSEVLHKCGEPDYREKWVEDRFILHKPHPLLPHEQSVGAVIVNLWTYNFGRRQFMRELRFENGRLVDIERLDYGF